jgi:hypothetical protein
MQDLFAPLRAWPQFTLVCTDDHARVFHGELFRAEVIE